MDSKKLLVRADATPEIGMGHVMRCLALSQGWKGKGGEVTFMIQEASSELESRLKEESIGVVYTKASIGSQQDAEETAAAAKSQEVDWVVVDGYSFDDNYQQFLKSQGLKLLDIDDEAKKKHYWADVVLNQNLYGIEESYQSKEEYTQLLMGNTYVLLRNEFLKFKDWSRDISPVGNKVLVTFGGSDPEKMTLSVLEALKSSNIPNLEVLVVLGKAFPWNEEVKECLKDLLLSVRIETDVNCMAEYMAWADVAIASSGSTAWELAFMKLPSLLVSLADNQKPVAKALQDRGVAVSLGASSDFEVIKFLSFFSSLLFSAEERTSMSQKSAELIDGKGVDRVLSQMMKPTISLRKVKSEDAKLIFDWANDSSTREASFSSKQIDWGSHCAWFENKCTDSDCFFYIALNNENSPVGQVRFEAKNTDEAIISVSVDPEFRGKGYGSLLICEGVKQLLEESKFNKVHAFIKRTNKASCQAFVKSGFNNRGEERYKEQIALRYEYENK